MASSIRPSPPRLRLADRLDGIAPSMTLAISAKARALKAQGLDVCSFGSGEPDFDTPEHIKRAAIEALERGETKYASVEGIARLREAIAQKLAVDNQLNYKPSQIQVSGGAKQALYNLMMALVNPGDEVIIPAPYWLSYPEMVRLAGGKPVILQTTEASRFKFTPADLDAAITPRTRLLVIASPSNPTSVMYTADELKAIGQVAVDRDLNGFSKSYAMTGWRLGYSAGPIEIIEAANIVQSHSLSNVTTFAQYGAIAALEGDQSAVEMMRQAFANRLEVMYSGLTAIPGISCVRPDGAFYLFPSIKSTGLDSMTFSRRFLEEEQVAVVPGLSFGGDDYVRFSYATDMATIEKGVERLGRFVSRL